jgi:hypothetical protein
LTLVWFQAFAFKCQLVRRYTVVPEDWEWGVECKPETLSAVVLHAPLDAAAEGTLSAAPGADPLLTLYRVDSPAVNYLSYPAAWFGNNTPAHAAGYGNNTPANQTLAEAQAAGRVMFLNGTMTLAGTSASFNQCSTGRLKLGINVVAHWW